MRAWMRITMIGLATGLALVLMSTSAHAADTISMNLKANGDGHFVIGGNDCLVHEVHTGVVRRDTNHEDNNKVFGRYRIDFCGTVLRSAPDGTPEVDGTATFQINTPIGKVWGSGFGAARIDVNSPNVMHYVDTLRVAGGTRDFKGVLATLEVHGTEVQHGTNFRDNFRVAMTLGA